MATSEGADWSLLEVNESPPPTVVSRGIQFSLARSSPNFSRSVQPNGLICNVKCRSDGKRVFPCISDYLSVSSVITGYSGCHVHRNRPQPELAPRHPPARGLARERQSQKTHPRQPLQVAPGENRHPAQTAQGRTAGRARRRLRHRALSAPWPCRGGAGDAAHTAPGPAHRPRALPAARARAGDGRCAHPRPRLEARHRPGTGRGDRARLARRDAGSRGVGRGRPVRIDGLAARAPGPHRAGIGETPSRRRHPGAQRPHLGVDGGTHLPAGQARPFARRQAG